MAKVWADRVKETTATTGTGTLTLAGAATQYQSFAAVGDGNTCDYCLLSGNGTDWETGQGTYTSSGTTLSRDIVYTSSNAGAKINLSGTSTVFLTAPARRIGGVFTRLFRTSNQANPGASTWAEISWQSADEDPLSAWSAGTPTYVTVPNGITKAKITLRATWSNVSTGSRYVAIAPPGGLAAPYFGGDIRSAINETLSSVKTPWTTVSAGNQIACYHNPGSSTSAVIVGNASITGTFGGATCVEFEWR